MWCDSTAVILLEFCTLSWPTYCIKYPQKSLLKSDATHLINQFNTYVSSFLDFSYPLSLCIARLFFSIQKADYEAGKNATLRLVASMVGPNGTVFSKLSTSSGPKFGGPFASSLMMVKSSPNPTAYLVSKITIPQEFKRKFEGTRWRVPTCPLHTPVSPTSAPPETLASCPYYCADMLCSTVLLTSSYRRQRLPSGGRIITT